jgi:hypothetical protein
MMRAKALYFPHIRVPNNSWFTRVLLYWDKVGSIVPWEYVENSRRLGRYMRELLDAELVIQVTPGAYLHEIPEFETAFLHHLKTALGIDGSQANADQAAWPRVHIEKMRELPRHLERLGVARVSEPNRWYFVEPRVADAFMAYLAGVLGQHPRVQLAPITDTTAELSLLGFETDLSVRTSVVRSTLLAAVLPAPAGSVPPESIVRFKEQYGRELRRFRTDIEVVCAQVAAVSERPARETLLNAEVNRLRLNANEIADAMRQPRWPRIVFGSLCAVAAAGLTATQVALDPTVVAGAGAGMSLINAIYSAVGGGAAAHHDQAMAYAALATRRI